MRQKNKEKLKPVSVYIPEGLFKKLEKKAAADRRSLSSQIVVLLEKAVQE